MSEPTLRRNLSVAVLLGLSVALTACGSPVGGGESSDKTLTVTAFDDDDIAVLKDVGKIFMKDHPGWKVDVTQIPEDNYVTKLRLAVSASAPPDVAYLYAKGEATNFQPLDDLLYTAHDLDPEDLNKVVLDYSCGIEDQLYCVGGYSGAVVLMYNKAAFDAAGVDYPSSTVPLTFEEYADLASQLTQPGPAGKDPVMWGGDAEPPAWYVDPGTFLSDDGKTAELTDPAYAETWTHLQRMLKDGDSPTADTLLSTGAVSVFAEGKLAMAIADNTAIGVVDEAGIEWGAAPVPVQPGDEPWVNVWTNAFGIPVNAAHPEEAADFLALLATDGQQLEADRGYMPLNVAEAERTFAAENPAQAEFFQVSQLVRLGTFTPNAYAWFGPFYDSWIEVAEGRSSVEDALAEAEKKVQPQLDVTWQVWNDSFPEQ